MPYEISVGPPVLTINRGNTVLVTDLDGSIGPHTELGLFFSDTRFVSYYEISANGQPWTRLSSSTTSYHSTRIYLINQEFKTEAGLVWSNSIALTINREAANGISENLKVVNYSQRAVTFSLEIALRSDFADIFEVRNNSFYRRGRIVTNWDSEHQLLSMEYSNQDFHRRMLYRINKADSPAHFSNGRVTFDLILEPAGSWEASADFLTLCQADSKRAPKQLELKDYNKLEDEWHQDATRLTSTNEEIYRFYQQSIEDLGAMQLHDRLQKRGDLWIPAAGVPWYVTLFGRDSLIVGLQNMFVESRLALGALYELADYQATEMDDWRDAEPGKIPHEIRYGELAHFKRIPHTPYYGSADSTPLFLIVLHETWKWLGDISLLKHFQKTAISCLDWIDKYGDLDGDGLQEYKTRSTVGYENMGWKDSGDAIVYPDGSQVKQPKALCELQGYVYDAWIRMSEVFTALGDTTRATSLKQKAAKLKDKFNESFWCEDTGFYALALDEKKQPVKTIASNIGHCLWSGIVSDQHAKQVVNRFFQPDLWCGWGIRTLTSENPAYNPHSYHLGSVWPHDNGLIALGFKRYGFVEEAARVARDISEAASYFVGHRLPELYAGIERIPRGFPVQYLQANVPQAWAAGSIFHLLQAILGLSADAPNKVFYVDPHLPRWLPDIYLKNISAGGASFDLDFWREGEETKWEAKLNSGHIEIKNKIKD